MHVGYKFLRALSIIMLIVMLPLAALAQPDFAIDSIELPDTPVYDVEVSPDRRMAAVYIGSFSRAFLGVPLIDYRVDPALVPVTLIDLADGTEIAQLVGETDYIGSLAFSPDSQMLAVSRHNGIVELWNTADATLTGTVPTMLGSLTVEFIGGGAELVAYPTGLNFGELFVFDIASGAMTRILRPAYNNFGEIQLSDSLTRLNYTYRVLDVSPDGAWLATATPNGEVSLWDTRTGEQTVVRERAEEPGRFNVSQVSFSRDSSILAYQYNDLGIQLWDIELQSDTVTFPAGNGARFGLSPSGDAVIWADRSGAWYASASELESPVSLFEIPEGVRAPAPTISFLSDDRALIGGFALQSDADDPNRIIIVNLNGTGTGGGSGWG